MRLYSASVSLFSAPAVVAALLVSLGLSGGVISGVLALLIAAGAGATLVVTFAPPVSSVSWETAARVGAGLVLGSAVVATGLLRIYAPSQRYAAALDPHSITRIDGRLVHDLRPGSSSYRVLTVDAVAVADARGWQSSAQGRVTLIWEGEEYLRADRSRTTPVRGETIRVTGLSGIDPWRLDRDPTIWVADTQLRITSSPSLSSLRSLIREWVRSRLARLSRPGGAVIPALLLGDRAALSPDLSDAVRAAGASHVLALSGMHLGVLALILHAGPIRFLPRRFRGVSAFPFLFLYVWIAGWIPSLVRALVLIGVASMARFRRRSVPLPILLARTAVLVGILSPGIVGNLGFKLSMLALLGIFVFAPRVMDELHRFLPVPVAAYTGVTIAAMTATAPLSLAVFGTIYPAGIVLAGGLSIMIVVQMWMGILFVFITQVPFLGTLLSALIAGNTAMILRVAELGYLFPAIRIDTGGVSGSGGVAGVIVVITPVIAVVVIVLLRHRVLQWRPLHFIGDRIPAWSVMETDGNGESQLDF